MKSKAKIAQFLCVQNEERFLEEHLRFHYEAGVRRAFLFLDSSSDRSREIAEKHSWIDIIEIPPEEKERHSYICDLHRACMEIALEWAKEEGWEWLLSIDPDEFILARPDRLETGNFEEITDLAGVIAGVEPEIHQVRFPTWEVIPEVDRPWWKQKNFQTEEQVSFALPGETERWKGFLGHLQGKSMIRTDFRAQPYDSHRWVIDQKQWKTERPEYAEIPTAWLGCHLHYYLTDPEHLIEKFRKATFEPSLWFCGTPVESPKQRYKEISERWSEEETANYLASGLDPRIEEGAPMEVSLIEKFVSAMGEGKYPTQTEGPAGSRNFPERDPESMVPRSSLIDLQLPSRILIQDLLPREVEGFHSLEHAKDEVIRWTQKKFSILVPELLSQKIQEVRLDLGQLWRVVGKRRIVLLGSHRIRGTREDSSWIFPTKGGTVRELQFRVSDTLSFPGEERELGIPIRAVELR